MSIDKPAPQPRTLSLMPTYRCTASCRSCGTLSSPHATESLTLEEVLSAISQAHDVGIGLVVFTGGEATLERDSLLAGLEYAHAMGMMTRLVTNCHWAASDEVSNAYVRLLRAAGLDEINYSTGDQHARFVPLENVLRAVRSALLADLVPAVMVETTAANRITADGIEHHPYQVQTRKEFPGRIIKINESPWMPLSPRKTQAYPPGMAIDRSNLSAVGGCDSILQTITVQADRSIGACCGLGMRLIPELRVGELGKTTIEDAISESEEDLLKRWIRLDGPERILAWAADKDPSIEWEGRYAHRCQACLRLYRDEAVRKVIAERYMEKIPDVLFGEYLLYEYERGPSRVTANDPSLEQQ